jgi:hypothetical protein
MVGGAEGVGIAAGGQSWDGVMIITLLEYPTDSYAIFRVRHTLFHLNGFVDTISKSLLDVSSQSLC